MNLLRSHIFYPRLVVSVLSVLLGSSALAQVTNTNTVTNGGIINVGDTQIITNPVTSLISAAITNNGSLQFWQTSPALTVSGVISGSGSVTKASGSTNLTLSGLNTFSNKVTVSSGTLTAIGVSDTVGSGMGLGTQVELGSGTTFGVTVSSGTNSTTRSLIANGSFTLANAGNGSLVWNGNVTNNATSASTFRFNSAGTGTNVFAGVIGNTTNNSLVSLDFQNTQIWSLTGSNIFGGGITIGGGKVIADKLADRGTASSIGTNNVVRLGYFNNAPSTFEYVGSGSTNNMQVKLGASAGTGNNPGIFLQNGTGALVLTNTTFTLTSDVATTNINRVLVLGGTNTADNTISGTINNNTGGANSNSTVSIVKDGSGKWILSGNSTHMGGTTISNGTLQIGSGGASGSVVGAITNNATLILSRSGNPNFTNVISGSGALIANNGSNNGAVTLSGASTFGGKVTVGASNTLYAMSVADSGTSALGTNNQVELGVGAQLYINVAAGVTNTTARQLVVNGGFTLGNFSNGVVVWNGNLVNNATSSSGFVLGAAGTGTNVFAGTISNSTNGSALSMTVTGASIWSLTGSNTFTGGVTLNDGRLVVSSLATNGSIGSGNFRMGGFANVPVLEYVGSGDTNSKQMRLGAGSAATGGRILANGTGALVFTNATFMNGADIQTAGLDRAIILGGTNTADNAITGAIGNVNSTNTVSIVKDDAGKWILGGINTYTGGTTVSNGVLELGQTGSLRFLIKGSGTNNQISGTGTLSLKGKFDFDLTGAATNVGSSWTVVASTLASSYESSFGITGFIPSGGQWSRAANGVAYVFQPSSGVLSIKLPVFWSVSFPLNLPYTGIPQFPLITPTGSTAPVFYSFTGMDGTTYSSTNPPTAPGNYKVTASVGVDGTYAPGSLDVLFSIGNFGNGPATPPLRVEADGTLRLDNRPFTGIGVNYYSVFCRVLENADDTSFDAGLAALGRWGVPVARLDVSAYWPSNANLFFTNRTEYFRRLDGVVASAERHGVGLIPSLFWTTFTFSDLAGEHLDQLAVSNSVTRQKMREFATEIVNRYKHSPAIWAWEFGNEWNLAVDLPNATEWLPPTWTNLGNPPTRDPVRDVLATDTILPAMLEFANLVRTLDPGRPISSGHAMSRPSQWHQDQWKRGLLSINSAWTTDSLAQAEAIALRQCPDPYDLLSVHVYENDTQRLPNFAGFAARAGKALFVGEFGTPPNLEANYAGMLATVRQYSPLAAVWAFDRTGDEYNITTNNARNWMLRANLPDNFSAWSRGYGRNDPTGPNGESAFLEYLFGAARPGSGPVRTVGGFADSWLSLEAVVRTNDLTTRVFGESTTNLVSTNWATNGVSSLPSSIQSGVLPGCERRIFSAPAGTNEKMFLRLRAK